MRWCASPAGRKDTGKATLRHRPSWEREMRGGGSVVLGAASSESFPVPPPAPPACSRQEARWGSSRDTDLADHVLGGGPIWKRAEEGQGRSCWPPPAWHRAPTSPPTPLRAAPPLQPSTALPHPNVPHAHTPRRPRHPRHQLRAAGRTTSSVPRAARGPLNAYRDWGGMAALPLPSQRRRVWGRGAATVGAGGRRGDSGAIRWGKKSPTGREPDTGSLSVG